MTLGQRINQYRKKLGLSQEALGEHLGVSRQAVSKWETDAASPDVENLLALARIFGVSVAELSETPELSPNGSSTAPPSRHFSPLVRFAFAFGCAMILTISLLLWLYWLEHKGESSGPPPQPPAATIGSPETPALQNHESITAPVAAPKTDFALLWYGSDGNGEFLELGTQETAFPFGTTLELTEPMVIMDTDFNSMTTCHSDCGNIKIDFYCIKEADSLEQNFIWNLSTMVSSIRTPRGIHVGNTKAQVLAAYGDKLVYCMKETGSYSLVKHDYCYAFQTPETGGSSLQLFMLDGIVAGIRVEHMAELGNTAFAPDHISRFPVKNGEPDFSMRQEPEKETRSDTWKVYDAWNQLVTNNNLSAEERYTYRRTIFSLLADLDWQEFGSYGFGGTPGISAEQFSTIEALMSWLHQQAPYSEGEIFRLQMGCTAKGLDGAYTDMYAHLLSAALFQDPIAFVKGLAYQGMEETMSHAVSLAAYDAIWYETDCSKTAEILEEALSSGSFTDPQASWSRLLLLYLTAGTEDGAFADLPRTPTE